MTEQQYIDYFEGLATRSRHIRHSLEEAHFFMATGDNYQEVEKAVRSRLNFPALVLDQYTDDILTAQDNCRSQIRGGFSVLCKVGKGADAVRQAQAEARTLAQKIYFRLRSDARQRQEPGLKDIFLDPDLQGQPAPLIGGIAAGWAYEFELTAPLSVRVDPEDWYDL